MKAFIQSTGFYVPEKIMTNDEWSQWVDTSDEWIYSHTGIRNRRVAAPDQSTSDLAVLAARDCLSNAGLPASELDMILVATTTPDYLSFPSTASLVQDKLGAGKAGAMDLSAACTGFVYALETARAMVEAGTGRHILVIGAEVFTRILNWKDRNTCILFGDGAGAVLVSPTDSDKSLLVNAVLRSDGSGGPALERHAGGTRYPVTAETSYEDTCVYMDGRRVYNFAVSVVKQTILDILEKNGKTLEDVAWIVPHQANVRIIDATAKRLGIGLEKFYLNMENYANTSGATIPLALGEMDAKGLLTRGDLILTVGFGAGLTYGANLLYW